MTRFRPAAPQRAADATLADAHPKFALTSLTQFPLVSSEKSTHVTGLQNVNDRLMASAAGPKLLHLPCASMLLWNFSGGGYVSVSAHVLICSL
jgi:hypothetical protein